MQPLDAELLTLVFVDNGGIARAKTVPAARAVYAATAGIGASTVFAVFDGLDVMGSAHGLEVPTGDMRLRADLEAAVSDGTWALVPADLVDTEGAPWPACSRAFARRMEEAAATRGLRLEMTFETEWIARRADGVPVHQQPAYGLEATRAAGDVLLGVVRRLQLLGIDVDQVHPEYAPGQLEVSVSRSGAVAAADRAVVVRDAIRTVGRELGLFTSLSPKVAPDALGSGTHLHISLWREDCNLFAGGDGRRGMTAEGEQFLAGLLTALDALVAVGCASPVSYLRLGPGRWTAAHACWGLENREAPLRLIQGSSVLRPAGANVELKTVDASGNPYLVVGAVIAAGLEGLDRGLTLQAECEIDPATMSEGQRAAAGIAPLPVDLRAATSALRDSAVLRQAMGDVLHDALIAVRMREAGDAQGVADVDLCERYRFRY